MGVLFKRYRSVFALTSIARLAVILSIAGLAASFVDTVWALYLESLIEDIAMVGFFSGFLTILSFASFFFIVPILERKSKSLLFGFSLFAIGCIYILFAVSRSFYFVFILASLVSILISLKISSAGIVVRDFSPKKVLVRNEGLMYTFMNIAWVLGPLPAGYIAEAFGISLVFILAGIFTLFAFLMLLVFRIKDDNTIKRVDGNVFRNFFDFFKSKKRVLSYFLSGGVNFWWTLIYLFMPIYIIRNGLSDIWVGYFLFAVPIPLVMLEFYFSKLAGKIGFRKIFRMGYLWLVAVSLLAFFFSSNIYLLMGIIVLGGIGAALLEPTTEAYFFDISSNSEVVRFYAPYNTTIDTNQFIAKMAMSSILLFLPFKFIFAFIALMMFVLFVLSSYTPEIVEDKVERARKRRVKKK